MSAEPAGLPADAREGQRWLSLLMALTALTSATFLLRAFVGPGAGYGIEDDARQFQAWMARIADPAAMSGNLIADYWQSVSPWLYREIFHALASLGLDPLIAGRLIPVPLLFATAWLAWRVASQLAPRPFVAFCMAVAVTLLEIHQGSVFTAAPRGFMAPLFLLFLDGLLRDRKVTALVGLLLLAALYPAPALVGLTILGLSRLRWSPRLRIDFSARSVLFVLAGVLAVGIAILPFRAETSRWEPTLSLPQARTLPNLMTPGARSAIVDKDGQIAWLCSTRIGFLPQVMKCRRNLGLATPINILLLVVPPLLLFGRALRRARRGEAEGTDRPGNLIYGYVFVAAVGWYLVATFGAFKLHLPSRYSQRVLDITGALALGSLAGRQLLNWADQARRDRRGPGRAAAGAALVSLATLFISATTHLRRPADPGAVTRLKATPADTRIAGVSLDLDFIPALAGRSVLAATEHAIPYQLGYFVPLRAGLRESVAAAITPDPISLAQFLADRRIDIFMIDRTVLAGGAVPSRYASLLADPGSAAARGMRSALTMLAPRCTLYAGPSVALIDGHCLIEAANARPMLEQPQR